MLSYIFAFFKITAVFVRKKKKKICVKTEEQTIMLTIFISESTIYLAKLFNVNSKTPPLFSFQALQENRINVMEHLANATDTNNNKRRKITQYWELATYSGEKSTSYWHIHSSGGILGD